MNRKQKFVENLRHKIDNPIFTVGTTMTIDGIGLKVTHIPDTKERVIDAIRDTAIQIVDHFVKDGLCPDCTDTDDETEFQYQDIIADVLQKELSHLSYWHFLKYESQKGETNE